MANVSKEVISNSRSPSPKKGLPYSLRAKLPLSILTVLLVSLSISTYYIIDTAHSVISYVKSSRIEDAASSIGRNVTMQLHRIGKEMTLLAGIPLVQKSIELSPLHQDDEESTLLRNNLQFFLDKTKISYGQYDSLWLMNEKGQLIAGTLQALEVQNISARQEWLNEVLRKNTLVVDTYSTENKTGDRIIPVALKVVYNGEAGILAGTLQLSRLTHELLRYISGPEINAYILDGEGNIIDTPNASIKQTSIKKLPCFPCIQDKVSGSLQSEIDGQMKTVGFYHIPQTDMYSVVIAESFYMKSYIDTIQKAAVVTGIISALLAVGCVCLFIFPVTGDIKKLSLFAKQITEGAQPSNTGVNRKDELGNLADSLEEMVVTLTDMVSRSEAATKAKSDFLARMSHEIRTPMNGIIGMTYLALKEQPEEKQRKFLNSIDAAAKNLLGIINDILDFSKIEANKMALTFQTIRLSEVLRSIFDMLHPKAQEKGLHLEFIVDTDVPDLLEADSLRLSQVCINLLSNALKFTETGSITLHISVEEKRGEQLLLLFSVKDTGIGISDEAQLSIFDSFTQADGTTTRKYGGTGLGLAISKSLVQMMGGKIGVASILGEGSNFYFTILTRPGAEVSKNDKDTLKESKEQATVPPLSILLAEDNEINQEIAISVLEHMGAKVMVAANGIEAVSLWETHSFDLILMDIQMPVMDGLTAAKRIRESSAEHSTTVPIIAMTANAMSSDREKSLAAGMNDHLTKPLDVEALKQALIYWGSEQARQ